MSKPVFTVLTWRIVQNTCVLEGEESGKGKKEEEATE